jgi:hypothetical protein
LTSVTAKTPEKVRIERGAWLAPAGIGVATTLVSLCLALLGYGYALAVESMFALPESLFADGPLDYLRLSSHVVAYWVTAVPDRLATLSIYGGIYGDYWPLGLGFTLLWGVFVFAGARQRLRLTATAAALAVRGSGLWLALLRWVSGVKWPVLSLAGIWGWPLVVLCVLAALLVVGSTLVSVVPLMGFMTGKASLQTWVVEPTVCVAPRSRSQRLVAHASETAHQVTKIRGVACVRIQHYDKERGDVPQGRLVVATAKWAVLFDPMSGEVQRVSIDNAAIVPVASLDIPTVGATSTAPPASSEKSPAIETGSVVGTARSLTGRP